MLRDKFYQRPENGDHGERRKKFNVLNIKNLILGINLCFKQKVGFVDILSLRPQKHKSEMQKKTTNKVEC